MTPVPRLPRRLAGLVACFVLGAGVSSSQLLMPQPTLSSCPASPNCVSSEAADAPHRLDPFEVGIDAQDVWSRVRAGVEAIPRTRIVAATDDRLHAECRSLVFGFVDDLELVWRPANGRIDVRSASRTGHWDLGVNRRRVERLRARLRIDGVIR
jgi:uncharacterized protein (DUF1499 family)